MAQSPLCISSNNTKGFSDLHYINWIYLEDKGYESVNDFMQGFAFLIYVLMDQGYTWQISTPSSLNWQMLPGLYK